jgi:DNA-binding CsgD family transcriptional regulator/PAS domain-containing protein
MTIPLDQAVDQSAAVGEARLRKSAVYNEVYLPQGHWPFLGTIAARSDKTFAGLGMMRSTRGDPPGREHFQMAERLSMHIGRALALSGVFGGETVPAGSFEQALQSNGAATLILDAAGRIVWLNQRAEKIIARGDGLGVRSRILVANDPADGKQLARAIHAAASGSISAVLIAHAKQRYVVRLQRLWPSQAIGRHNIIATIKTARRRAQFDQAEAAAMFGLTAAEARAACEICSNPGIETTARKLNISPNTMKTLLRRCFEKLGVRSQGELAMLFISSLHCIEEWWL